MQGLMYLLIGFLALFGLIVLMMAILNSIRQRLKLASQDIKLVLLLKNQEDTVEGILRDLYASDAIRKAMSGRPLTVVDLGSTDGTVSLLKRLKQYYSDFEILEENEKENIFLGFKKENIQEKQD